ncbi:MAG: hypothetical protein EHM58_00250 [Ignavibacteriae bacterium]|nr:MAG: hypothetical protein EHM58_00250 [Ignavibacteriota bacterium]
MKIICTLLLVLFFSVNSYSQTGTYTWLHPKLTAERLNAININGVNIFVVGNAGVLMMSTNSGANWVFKKVNDTTFHDVFSIGNDVHIAGGSYDNRSIRHYSKSTNNGVTFTSLTQNTIVTPGDTLNLRAVYFTDANTGYIAGASGKMFRTTNGGLNWASVITGVTTTINKLYFPASGTGMTGFAIGGSGATAFFLKTINAGLNWTSTTLSANPTGSNATTMHFIDANTGYIAGGSSISPITTALKTTDGGASWTVFDIDALNPNIRYELFGVYVLNENLVYAAGANGNIIRTTDGGASWQKLFPESNLAYQSAYLTGMSFIGNTGYISGAGGTIIKVQDTSITFMYGEIMKHAYDVRFSKTDSLLGFVVGGGQRQSTGQTVYYALLDKTTNGGATWTPQILSSSNIILKGIEMIDNNNIWVCGDSGKVMRTTNSGNSWELINIGAIENLEDIRFKNASTGFIGGNGRIFRTTNGGANWTFSTFTGGTNVREMDITPNSTIVAGVNGAFTQRSTDNGVTWVSATVPNSNYPHNVYFLNDTLGWVCGLIANIARTTNGGISWTAQTSGIFAGSLDGGMHFWDVNNGAAWGLTGLVLRTTNGGVNWFKTYPFTQMGARNVYFANNNRGYITTDMGGLMSFTNLMTSIIQVSTETPNEFKLCQNYPNPFNPVTKIVFSIPPSGEARGVTDITLKIYDILGREITLLLMKN